LLSRMDRVAEAPETEYANGKGYVPKWQNHWVSDPDTESKLEEMAEILEMQHELQEGCMLLKGHAGTGKDVLVKMFCERAKRPYFAIDCTKWTTEYELGEDITLESKDGASQTVKVPSVVLQAITTPGAVMYFNEFNAMNEQAQIFLHALMDEKRSITLKTSSGKTIKADPDVLLIASMNPNYPGTFAPQFATRSRMVSVDVDYPSLLVKPKEGDTNLHPCYNVSEPLRIARSVASLADFTIEGNMERNEFVKIWNKYINHADNDAPPITPTQQFDLEVILALVQFGDKLRTDFIKIFEKTEDSVDALPVTQPITLREMRRCAYFLSKMSDAEKLAGSADPDEVARNLLAKFFLTHIDKRTDRDVIQTSMTGNWHSQKRLAA
ncbi:MAG: MoxR family ATPase, partial [Candidatus Peregrinibacteria bacterium]